MGKYFQARYCPGCGDTEPDLTQILLWIDELRVCADCGLLYHTSSDFDFPLDMDLSLLEERNYEEV